MNHLQKNEQRLIRLKKIAYFLDNKFEGPFGIRFGMDPILGLIPILGDLITLTYSLYILLSAYTMGCPVPVLVRMSINLIIEFVIEMTPVFGPLGDAFWKSNSRNISLLEKHIMNSKDLRRQSVFFIYGLVIALCLIAMGTAYIAYILLSTLIRTFM